MSLRINSKMCSTCIFGKKSPVSQERFEDLKESWETDGKHQECHHFTMKQENVGCRGHYESAKRGEVSNYPAHTMMNKVFGMNWDAKEAMEFGERLGLIVFIDEKKEKE